MVIDAALWRDRRSRKLEIGLAWRIANLMRTKRLPKLSDVLAEPSKPLRGKALDKRRREYRDMTAGVDLEKLNKKMRIKKDGT